MGYLDNPIGAENSEASKNKETTVASFTKNERDFVNGFDEEQAPKFLFDYRGKPEHPGAGNGVRSNTNIRPEKQVNIKVKEQEPSDDLDRRATANKAKADKKTT